MIYTSKSSKSLPREVPFLNSQHEAQFLAHSRYSLDTSLMREVKRIQDLSFKSVNGNKAYRKKKHAKFFNYILVRRKIFYLSNLFIHAMLRLSTKIPVRKRRSANNCYGPLYLTILRKGKLSFITSCMM